MRKLVLLGASVGALLVGLAATTTATASTAPAQRCPGRVGLSYGDIATRIIAKNVGCQRAKRIIKAPASKRGYTCTNPFDAPHGSGGFIHCRKGDVRIRFLYGQS